jgi:hypothetical protein
MRYELLAVRFTDLTVLAKLSSRERKQNQHLHVILPTPYCTCSSSLHESYTQYTPADTPTPNSTFKVNLFLLNNSVQSNLYTE